MLRLQRISGRVAFGLAVTALCLSFVPILFPVTVAFALLAAAAAALLLYLDGRRTGNPIEARLLMRMLRHPSEQQTSRVSLRAARTIRIAVVALGWNLLLYSVIGVHSWLCFVRSFDRELEPIRKAFRVIAEEPAKSPKSAKSPKAGELPKAPTLPHPAKSPQ